MADTAKTEKQMIQLSSGLITSQKSKLQSKTTVSGMDLISM